ncbi:MAG: hypothetical protein RR276_01480 [Angelakisella sp.]
MQQVLRITNNPQVTVAGHVFGYLPFKELLDHPTTFDERQELSRTIVKRCFTSQFEDELIHHLVTNNICYEIHGPSESTSPAFLQKCLSAGVRFTIGSDAHAVEAICNVEKIYQLANRCGITEQNLWGIKEGALV